MACDIAFLAHDFSGSGVVRNGIRLANHAAALDLKVAFWVTLDQGVLREHLDPRVKIFALGHIGKSRLPRRLQDLAVIGILAKKIRKIEPKILFSSGNHYHLTAVAAWHLAGKPRTTQLMGRASNALHRGLLARIEILKFACMDPVFAVADELAEQLKQAGMDRKRIRVIANGVDTATIENLAKADLDDDWFRTDAPPVIIGAGRLSQQKNFSLLLDAFALARQHMPLRLVILGDGRERQKLLAKTKALGLAADVRFPGHVANPVAYFARSSLFVLSSRWEGMSNVLIEAMAAGTPVVAVRAPTGTAEILDNGRFGPLVKAEPHALSEAILARLAAPRDINILQSRAADYELSSMLKAYEPFFRGK